MDSRSESSTSSVAMSDRSRHYVGITNDIDARLAWHNNGPSGYSIQYRPWSLVVALQFPTEQEAVRFEKYLKSGSGRAFAKRHFAPPDRSDSESPSR